MPHAQITLRSQNVKFSSSTTLTETSAALAGAPPGSDALAVATQSSLRRDLGLIQRWRADRAASEQCYEATREIDATAIAATTDVTVTAIEQRRAELKAALAAAGVVRYVAIAQELLLRVSITHEQLTDIQFEGFMRQVKQRAGQIGRVDAAHVRGELSAAEYECALNEVARMIERDNERLANATGRVKDAVDALVETATQQISRGRERLQAA